MIVRLEHDQYRVVMNRVSTLHREAMEQHQSKVGVKQRDFDLPAIAWRQILDHLTATSYGPVGGKMPDVSPSVYTAVKRIASRVMEIEAHPALRGAAIEGWHGECVPVFATPGVAWSPYPNEHEMFVLSPTHKTLHGLKITQWSTWALAKGVGWTFGESAHRMFEGRSAKPEHLADS